MRNTLADLNNHLFAQLEKISDDSIINDEKLDLEIRRTEAIIDISETIIKNATLTLEAVKVKTKAYETSGTQISLPNIIGE